MTKTERKHKAQDNLMSAMQVAFLAYEELNSMHVEENLREEMEKQFERVEKLFGYEKGTWSKGI